MTFSARYWTQKRHYRVNSEEIAYSFYSKDVGWMQKNTGIFVIGSKKHSKRIKNPRGSCQKRQRRKNARSVTDIPVDHKKFEEINVSLWNGDRQKGYDRVVGYLFTGECPYYIRIREVFSHISQTSCRNSSCGLLVPPKAVLAGLLGFSGKWKEVVFDIYCQK
ncbi:hypothetical protein RhiirA4_449132 [Rhizophagus irregularis]|uniref:Uncharacterized protein n=1 Tax=Rhizophagus irregularis TaxID=588596 RepID=A0A2I1HG34_9GLOM|nr:hypothetical protein RhiirA4_449132 [Rhizophagus irregularis]